MEKKQTDTQTSTKFDKKNQEKSETLTLGWLDPRDHKVNHAGVAFYNPEYGEYLLKIDEDPIEKQYFLKPFESDGQGFIRYRMEWVVNKKNGQFLKRPLVGHGYSDPGETQGNVFIQYGSKFKTLVLCLKD